MDQLAIQELSVLTHIGVHEWEQRIFQPLLLDIVIQSDFSHCQDALSETLDYDHLCQTITHFVETRSFLLIETVANAVAKLIKEEFRLEKVTVSVSKSQAIKNAKNVKVTVTR